MHTHAPRTNLGAALVLIVAALGLAWAPASRCAPEPDPGSAPGAAKSIAVLDFELHDLTPLPPTAEELQRTASLRLLVQQTLQAQGSLSAGPHQPDRPSPGQRRLRLPVRPPRGRGGPGPGPGGRLDPGRTSAQAQFSLRLSDGAPGGHPHRESRQGPGRGGQGPERTRHGTGCYATGRTGPTGTRPILIGRATLHADHSACSHERAAALRHPEPPWMAWNLSYQFPRLCRMRHVSYCLQATWSD